MNRAVFARRAAGGPSRKHGRDVFDRLLRRRPAPETHIRRPHEGGPRIHFVDFRDMHRERDISRARLPQVEGTDVEGRRFGLRGRPAGGGSFRKIPRTSGPSGCAWKRSTPAIRSSSACWGSVTDGGRRRTSWPGWPVWQAPTFLPARAARRASSRSRSATPYPGPSAPDHPGPRPVFLLRSRSSPSGSARLGRPGRWMH